MDRIFVLGSNSFGGAWFVSHALNNGYKVCGISRSDEPDDIFLPYKGSKNFNHFRFHQLDLNQNFDAISNLIYQFDPHYVVDFAGQGMVAPSWDWPEQWYQTNVVAKVKLHNKLRRLDHLQKYVRISTPEVYGAHEDLINETYTYNPSTPYAVSHAAIDMSLTCFYRQYDFPVVFTRFANFFGEHQQLYRIAPRSIICALTDETLMLHGGGASIRAFIHGYDVADGVLRAMLDGKPGESYHFSTTEFVSIYNIVEKIADVTGIPMPSFTQISDDRPGKDFAYLMDATKANQELEWVPKYSLDEGIHSCVEWVQKHLELIKTLPQDYIHQP